MKRNLAILLFLAVWLMGASCDPDDVNGPPPPPELGSVTQLHTMRAGEVLREPISATHPEKDAMTFRVVDNPGFVSIENFSQLLGTASATLVIAPGVGQEGTYQFQVRVEDSHGGSDSESCTVEVTPPLPASVEVSPGSASVTVGQTVTLNAVPRDADGNPLDRPVTWSSSNPSVATVNADASDDAKGIVTGVAEGSVTITATSEGKSGNASITVTRIPCASVEVTPTSATIEVGETVQLNAVPRDADGNALGDRTITWSTSDAAVATVSASGLVTGVGGGSATISATCEGKSGTAAITVNAPPTATIGSPVEGTTYAVGAMISFNGSGSDPEDGVLTGDALVWTSSVDGQIGTGESFTRDDLSAGEHTIELTATDGRGATGSATVAITINAPPTATIDSPAEGATYTEGEAISFSGSGVDPEDGTLTGDALVWTSEVDGEIGTGESFTHSDLSVGEHTIELTATDSHGATDTDAVVITVEEGITTGEWQAPTEFGQIVFVVNPTGDAITEITYDFAEWECGPAVWQGWARHTGSWPITDGQFTIESQVDENLTMTVTGTFHDRDDASGTWTGDSYGTICSGSWQGKPATRLFLRWDSNTSTRFLSHEQDPETSWRTRLYTGSTANYAATLEDAIADNTYTFWLWLRAHSEGAADGDYDVALIVDQNGSETELASTTFTVPTDSSRYTRIATVTGQSGGAPGDQLTLRVTYQGDGFGDVIYGRSFDSHVIVPGHITVSMPSGTALFAARGVATAEIHDDTAKSQRLNSRPVRR